MKSSNANTTDDEIRWITFSRNHRCETKPSHSQKIELQNERIEAKIVRTGRINKGKEG